MRNKNENAPLPRNKVLRTIIDSRSFHEVMTQHGYEGTGTQFRILCRCSNITDANEQCRKAGFHFTVFSKLNTEQYDGSNLPENENIWVTIDGVADRLGFLPWSQLNAEIQARSV